MTLRIHDTILRSIFDHARAEHPIEACGVLVADDTESVVDRAVWMTNMENSTEFFRLDPEEQLRVWQMAEDEGGAVVGVYHSHTSTRATPSTTDSRHLIDPDLHYLIVSTADPEPLTTAASYRSTAAGLVQEPIKVVQ